MRKRKQTLAILLVITSILLLACNKADTIICGDCSATNAPDNKYCSSCGTAFLKNSTTQATEQTQTTAQTQVQKYIGQYETSEKDACFTIYGVSNTDEVYFEADWYRLNGFGGVAKFDGEQAVFSVSVGTEDVVGSFTFDDNSIVLTITDIDLSYIEKGQYTYSPSGNIYKERTYCGMGELNHDAFTNFLSKENKDDSNWEYCGTVGEIFIIPGEEYADIFDLYFITQNNAVTYYVVKPSIDLESYEIYKVGNAGELEKVSYPSNSNPENNESSSTGNNTTSNSNNSQTESNWDFRVDEGMSKSQVDGLWGSPIQITRYQDGSGYSCYYYDMYGNHRMVIYDNNFIVIFVLGDDIMDSASNNNNHSNTSQSSVVGKWYASYVMYTSGGMKNLDDTYYTIELFSDGTGTENFLGEVRNFKWTLQKDNDGLSGNIQFGTLTPAWLYYRGSNLIIDTGSSQTFFSKG